MWIKYGLRVQKWKSKKLSLCCIKRESLYFNYVNPFDLYTYLRPKIENEPAKVHMLTQVPLYTMVGYKIPHPHHFFSITTPNHIKIN